MTVEIEGVTLHLAQPDELSIQSHMGSYRGSFYSRA
jgi:hypothetical protein